MKSNELGSIAEADDIALQIEQFKMGLNSRATGGSFDEKEYSTIRKMILGIPGSTEIIPKFLKICRTSDEFWAWIKGQAPSYAERRVIIAEALNPLLEMVEYEQGEGALDFKKNYEEKKVIGNGGFGLVYLYEHKLLKLDFAVKIFAPAFYQGGEKELERFFQEARMLFLLDHPAIIKVYDAGLMGSRPFIRMEYFNGRNLNEILSDHGTLNPQKALTMMKSLASAISHAHEKGIIHRDLKPSNIMAAAPNLFRVIDFGLGIFVENELHSRLTKTGEGTISGYYNAPELVENPKLIDKRSDIYSLGAIWFTMLTGQPPAGSNVMARLRDLHDLSPSYIKCIEGCLANLNQRTQSCQVLFEQLVEIEG